MKYFLHSDAQSALPDLELPDIVLSDEQLENVREKIIKQLPNVYKNTNIKKHMSEDGMPDPELRLVINAKRLKSFALNIKQRAAWYSDIDKMQFVYSDILNAPMTIENDRFYCAITRLKLSTKYGVYSIDIPLYNLNITLV